MDEVRIPARRVPGELASQRIWFRWWRIETYATLPPGQLSELKKSHVSIGFGGNDGIGKSPSGPLCPSGFLSPEATREWCVVYCHGTLSYSALRGLVRVRSAKKSDHG